MNVSELMFDRNPGESAKEWHDEEGVDYVKIVCVDEYTWFLHREERYSWLSVFVFGESSVLGKPY